LVNALVNVVEAAKGRVGEVGVSPALVGVAPGIVVEGTVVLAVENLMTVLDTGWLGWSALEVGWLGWSA